MRLQDNLGYSGAGFESEETARPADVSTQVAVNELIKIRVCQRNSRQWLSIQMQRQT